MEFMIDESGMRGTFSEFDTMQRELKKTKNQVAFQKSTLAIHGSTRNALKQNIGDLTDDLELLIQKLARMEDGLEIVVNAYRECENRILGKGNEGAVTSNANSANGSVIQQVRDWFDDLCDRFKEWREKQEAQNKEKKADKQMQKEMRKLLKSERYSSKTWKKASVAEREQILRELFQDLQDIFHIEVDNLYIEEIESLPGYITYGYLIPSNGKMSVTLNESLLSDPQNYERIMNTMIHEMRHGYQHSVVEHPENYEVTDETVESWRANFNDYKRTEYDGYEAYRNQPVEKDARGFADEVIGG